MIYSVYRDELGYIGCIMSDTGLCIPLVEGNRHYDEFLLWKRRNPDHGLDLRPYVEPVPVVDQELERLRMALASDTALSDDDVKAALRRLIR